MLTSLLGQSYNIDSTRGLNKALRTALVRSAKPFTKPADQKLVPGGILSAPDAIATLKTGGFLPPSASASSFPVFVAVALVGVAIGLILAVVIYLCIRTVLTRRQARRERLREHQQRLLRPEPGVHTSDMYAQPPDSPDAVRVEMVRRPPTATAAQPPPQRAEAPPVKSINVPPKLDKPSMTDWTELVRAASLSESERTGRPFRLPAELMDSSNRSPRSHQIEMARCSSCAGSFSSAGPPEGLTLT